MVRCARDVPLAMRMMKNADDSCSWQLCVDLQTERTCDLPGEQDDLWVKHVEQVAGVSRETPCQHCFGVAIAIGGAPSKICERHFIQFEAQPFQVVGCPIHAFGLVFVDGLQTDTAIPECQQSFAGVP